MGSEDNHHSQTSDSLGKNSTYRKVRLFRPDGKVKDEWIPNTYCIADAVDEFAPQALCGSARVFIAGFRARPDALLANFADDVNCGLLLLEFRAKDVEDW